jgi:hypothetical protein
MLGHNITYSGSHPTGPLLPPIPLASTAPTVRRIAQLSAAASAYHAAAGNAYVYAGTLVLATRERDETAAGKDDTGQATTAVHFVEPAVVRYDTGGLLVALGSALPASRLTVRCPPGVAPPHGSRLQQLGHGLERIAAASGPTVPAGVHVRVADTEVEKAFARRLSQRVLPDRSVTLVARSGADLLGQLTWSVRNDPLDRQRRAEVMALSVLDDLRAWELIVALLDAMEQHVARVPGLRMRMLTVGPTADTDMQEFLSLGWTHTFTVRGMEPWMRVAH